MRNKNKYTELKDISSDFVSHLQVLVVYICDLMPENKLKLRKIRFEDI